MKKYPLLLYFSAVRQGLTRSLSTQKTMMHTTTILRFIIVACCFFTFNNVVAGDAENGKLLAQSKGCIACHGLDGMGIADIYPNLAGQHERYLIDQMHAFRSKKRENALMYPFAASLTDAEIRDLSAYYSGL